MYKPVYVRQFNRDIKKIRKQGRDFKQFRLIIKTLLAGDRLDPIFKDHKLAGCYAGRRECHISSDWLLIYKVPNDMIIFERLGTHSELFRL